MKVIAVNRYDYEHLREIYTRLGYEEKDLRQDIEEIREGLV